MFTKEERLFIWKKVYEMIDRLEDGEYICVALRNVVFMYFKTHKKYLTISFRRNGENIFPRIGGEDKYGHRTRGNKNVLWVVWLS